MDLPGMWQGGEPQKWVDGCFVSFSVNCGYCRYGSGVFGMKYMGSKRRIAKYILPIMLEHRKSGQFWVEPFVGGANTIDKVDGNRIGADKNEYIAELWKALIYRNWQPPTSVSEEEYNDIKRNRENYPKELVGFCGVALTFGSTWLGTYARNKKGTNYAMEGRKNLMDQVRRLQGTTILNYDFIDLPIPQNSLVYCDPPYEGVRGYKDKFDHAKFWQWCRDKSEEGHTLFISEYKAPDDFICVWSGELKTNMDAKHTTKPIEKLFTPML